MAMGRGLRARGADFQPHFQLVEPVFFLAPQAPKNLTAVRLDFSRTADHEPGFAKCARGREAIFTILHLPHGLNLSFRAMTFASHEQFAPADILMA
jgi:hypothetical protein